MCARYTCEGVRLWGTHADGTHADGTQAVDAWLARVAPSPCRLSYSLLPLAFTAKRSAQ